MSYQKKLLSPKQAIKVSSDLKKNGERLILTGGCFDILHKGHVMFIQKAKEQTGTHFILLENDASIKKSKGPNRPIHSQEDRAYVLAHLTDVDYIVLLPGEMGDQDYDELIFALKPAIIATTKGDPTKIHKLRQAKSVGAKLVEVVKPIKNTSTSQLEQKIIDLIN